MTALTECALPWHHVRVNTQGQYSVCCRHEQPAGEPINIHQHPVQVWRTSKYLESVQNSLSQGDPHPGCASCWTHEAQGIVSLRQKTNQDYALLGPREPGQLLNVEIDVGNLCNLRCLMCNESSSSAILAENRRLGINQLQQKDLDWTDASWQHIQELIDQRPRVLSVLGGEPMYNRRLLQLLNGIPQAQAETMMLHLVTNGTTCDPEWQQALSRFRLVRLMFSVDAVGELYNYMRHGADWAHTVANIQQLASLQPVKPVVHCVVQNLNMASLAPLIDWAQQQQLYLQFDLLQQPAWLEINCLPDSARQQALEAVDGLLQRFLAPHHRQFLESCAQILTTSAGPEQWQQFLLQVRPRDQLRGTSFEKFISQDHNAK